MKETKSIRFTPDLADEIQTRAAVENRSFNNMIETIVIHNMRNYRQSTE